MHDFKQILSQFATDAEFVDATEISSGHINDTFLIKTTDKPYYILQRINHEIFPDVPKLVENKVLISRHLKDRMSFLPEAELKKRVLDFIPAREGNYYYRDENGNYWNLTVYIEGCVVYLRVPNEKVAFGGGKLFGEFLYYTRDFDPSRLFDVIPNFHKMSFRLSEFDEALENASDERKELASELISFADERRPEMLILDRLYDEGKLPTRATHNDTKISNALFSKHDDEAFCVIDTDTVMAGILHYDFGDAVRTICNTADEDESDPEKVGFNMDFFRSFTRGFMGVFGDEVSDLEKKYLGFSSKVMTFIVGLRFLTDFLQDDVYFRTKYELQNLDRAKCQFKLVTEIEKNLDEMNEIVKSSSPSRVTHS